MCRIISQERYQLCGHTAKCHLKHGLVYCQEPNGVPLDEQALENQKEMYLTKFCPEDTWKDWTLNVDGYCPSCVRQREKISVAGWRRTYACRHTRVGMMGKALQGCFSPNWKGLEAAWSDGKENKARGKTLSPFQFGTKRECSGVAGTGIQNPFVSPHEIAEGTAEGNPECTPADVGIQKFNNDRDNSKFSWWKFQQLSLWGEKTRVACPECQRVWVRRQLGIHTPMDIDEDPEKKNGPRYRAKKPQGLEVEIYNDDLTLPRVERVRDK
ncbi:predicted protein [Uncinocarpus reesii 1704]|uniref:Uncharacterized protein n=1 Tax=Uncinocarpus reesii (strain UAMH 1704) TaxID=336963 RepID=C4JXL6_UNCRE|nr:uncharacterized protein UREG_06389 [Uncinocarpus reesii 1704]EEP81524.1 predicted protein [Uncinocarpus reesii 1704]